MKQEIKLDKEIILFLKEHGNIFMETDIGADYQEQYLMFPTTIFLEEELTGKLYIVTGEDIPKQLK